THDAQRAYDAPFLTQDSKNAIGVWHENCELQLTIAQPYPGYATASQCILRLNVMESGSGRLCLWVLPGGQALDLVARRMAKRKLDTNAASQREQSKMP